MAAPIWITGYSDASSILHSKAFREVTFKGLVPLIGHTIVTVEGVGHRERRVVEGRLFATSVLQSYESSVVPQIIEETLQPVLEKGAGCLVQISRAVASRIAARVIGLDGLDDPTNLTDVTDYISALVGGPQVKLSNGETMLRREARNLLRERFINSAIDRRRNLVNQYKTGKLEREQLPFDLITLLLLQSPFEQDTKRDKGWEVRQIAAEASFYAVAAADTTATLVPRMMHELWRYVALFPHRVEFFANKTFLRDAAAEALRLHPVVPTIFRQTTQKVEIAEHLFEEGQVAGLYIARANRDEEIFGPNATHFDPLRKVPPKIRRAGLSFGGGSHLCLGRELALGAPQIGTTTEIELCGEAALLAHALFRHQAHPDPAHPVKEPTEYERDVFEHYPILLG